MALIYSLPSNSMVMFQKHSPLIKKPLYRLVVMVAQPQISQVKIHSTAPIPQIKPSSNNKVFFEDHSNGIVCYRDGISGEITCEGYDEGPRLDHEQLIRPTCNTTRDTKIIDMLHRSWLQVVVDDDGVVAAAAAAKYSDSNGFNNTLC